MPPQNPVTYLASIRPLTVEGKRYADIEIMNTSLNDAGWGAKPEAIEKARQSLLANPLLYIPGPGETPDYSEESEPFWGGSHIGEWKKSGTPISAEIRDDGSLHATYDVTSDKAWEDLQKKKAKAVSPSCRFYEARITAPENGKPSLWLEDFKFDHVLLLPPGAEGAYPQSQVEILWETESPFSGFSAAVSAALSSQASWLPEGVPSNYFDSPWAAEDFAVHTDKVRKLPYKNPRTHKASEEGVRAALRRFHQTDFPAGTKNEALKRLLRAAKELGIESSLAGSQPQDNRSEPKLEKEEYEAKVSAMTAQATAQTTEMVTLKAAVETKEKELKDAKEKLDKAGKTILEFEEGHGIKMMLDEKQVQINQLGEQLENTRNHLGAVEAELRDEKINKLVEYKLQGRLLNAKDIPAEKEKWKKATFDAIAMATEDARNYMTAIKKLGLRSESYGAGATAPTTQASRGLTIGSPITTPELWKKGIVEE